MAEKRKKTRHTRLVLPGDKPAKHVYTAAPHAAGGTTPGRPARRGTGAAGAPPAGRAPGHAAEEPRPSAFDTTPGGNTLMPGGFAGDGPEHDLETLPENAVRMPKPKKRRRSPAKRRRFARRLAALVVLLALAAGFVVYRTGFYLLAGTVLSDWTDTLRINAQGGDGFPISFSLTGFIQAEGMGKNGLAVLGRRDLAFISAGGARLNQVQHTYPTPGFSAGDTRAVLYNRGGREFVVEGRTGTLARRTTEQDILFAEMSPGGWLAVVTSSRYRATLHVYSPTYDTGDPQLTWPLVDEKPVLAGFSADSKTLVLGCLSTSGGAVRSTLHLLRRDSDAVQATVTADDALVLRAELLPDGKLLAIYDSFAALYDGKGREMLRYGYGGRQLLAADINDGALALVFGSSAQKTLHAVLLNSQLQPVLDYGAAAGGTPQVLAAENGLWLLQGRQLAAVPLAGSGAVAAIHTFNTAPHALVWGGGMPLLITGTAVEPLPDIPTPPPEE